MSIFERRSLYSAISIFPSGWHQHFGVETQPCKVECHVDAKVVFDLIQRLLVMPFRHRGPLTVELSPIVAIIVCSAIVKRVGGCVNLVNHQLLQARITVEPILEYRLIENTIDHLNPNDGREELYVLCIKPEKRKPMT
jgi:hypothetical protein